MAGYCPDTSVPEHRLRLPAFPPHTPGHGVLTHLTLCRAILFLKCISNFINFDALGIFFFFFKPSLKPRRAYGEDNYSLLIQEDK